MKEFYKNNKTNNKKLFTLTNAIKNNKRKRNNKVKANDKYYMTRAARNAEAVEMVKLV